MNTFDSRGLTLIEIMVSVMILLITITGLMTTYTHLNKQASKMQQKRFALRFAQKRLEECMANPNCLNRSDYREENISIDEQHNFRGTLEIDTNSITSDCRKIECRIIWIDGDVSLTTIWGN